MMQKTFKMIESLANGYSYESAQWELSNEYKHDRVQIVFKFFLRSCVSDESSLSIERANKDNGDLTSSYMYIRYTYLWWHKCGMIFQGMR